MIIYSRNYDAAKGQIVQASAEMEVVWRSAVETNENLPTSNNMELDARYVMDSNHLYVYLNGVWVDQGAFDIGNIIEERIFQGLS